MPNIIETLFHILKPIEFTFWPELRSYSLFGWDNSLTLMLKIFSDDVARIDCFDFCRSIYINQEKCNFHDLGCLSPCDFFGPPLTRAVKVIEIWKPMLQRKYKHECHKKWHIYKNITLRCHSADIKGPTLSIDWPFPSFFYDHAFLFLPSPLWVLDRSA